MSEDVKLLPETEREIEAIVHWFGDAIRRDNFDPATVTVSLHHHLTALVKEDKLSNHTDRPDVAEVERACAAELIEFFYPANPPYRSKEAMAEDMAVVIARHFLTALRALGDAEWKPSEAIQEFISQLELIAARPGPHGPKVTISTALARDLIRSLRRTPAGG